MPLRTIAGHKFKHDLWLKCQRCDRMVLSSSKWIKWWLVAPRKIRNKRNAGMILCPEHVTRSAMVFCGAKGARAKGFKLWLEEAKNHYDDDPQPDPDLPIVFPNEEEYKYFVNTPFNVRW